MTNRFLLCMLTGVFALLIPLTVSAQEMTSVTYADGDGSDDAGCVNEYCGDCCGGNWFFTAEATFFKFHDSGGVEDADADDGEFDWDVAPRLTLGYVNCEGAGVRIRYWDFDEDTITTGGGLITVDTYSIDLEAFQVVDLGCSTSLEVSGGVRYNDFYHFIEDGVVGVDTITYDGWGGMIGIEARRDLGCGKVVYARLREIIMTGDAFFDGPAGTESDTIRPVTEIALGVAYRNCNWSFNAGFEWQNWGNYSSDGSANVDQEASDVGFAGFVLGGEYSY